MNNKLVLALGLFAAALTASIGIAAVGNGALMTKAYAQQAGTSTVTRDSILVIGPRTISSNSYIHLYDSNPYHIMRGHVAMQVPCDDKSVTPLEVFVGQAPNLSKVSPQLVKELSTPGKECMYHFDIASHQDSANPIITDVVVKNTGKDEVKLSDVSTISVGVDEIMLNPGLEMPHSDSTASNANNNTSGNNNTSTTTQAPQ